MMPELIAMYRLELNTLQVTLRNYAANFIDIYTVCVSDDW